ASFLTGLALGSVAFARLADRARNPLRLYGLLESTVALLALCSPWVFRALAAGLLPHPGGPAGVVLVTALLIVPPTFLMGGTFPLVLAAFLLGIASGSLAYGRRKRRDPRRDLVHFAHRAALASALFAVLLTLAPLFLQWGLRVGDGRPVVMAVTAFLAALATT